MEYIYPFTYEFYSELVDLLVKEGYHFSNYHDCDNFEKTVIMRHDIDNSIDKALELARLENSLGITSTYFVLLTSPFYNVFQKSCREKLVQIHELGHDIGLHFDELSYDLKNDDVCKLIQEEAKCLEKATSIKIKSVSMHRPSKKTLEADYKIDNIINSYGKKFFKEYKYLSDSRRRWREDVMSVVKSGEYDKLHILTHSFWYNQSEIDIKKTLKNFINVSKIERYDFYSENFTNLEEIIKRSEIL